MTVVRIIDRWIHDRFPSAEIYTTLEGDNPGGSIKDHMVKGELERLLQEGILGPGDGVAEISAGSTAISLAYYCQQMGLKCHLFVPDNCEASLLKRLQEMQAQVTQVAHADGFQKYQEFIASSGIHPFDQFFDKTKGRYYVQLGQQIQRALGRTVDMVVGAVGTGHSLKGIADGMTEGVLKVSAEPAPLLKIAGIRNIEVDHFGENDPCSVRDFSKRMIISDSQRCPLKRLESDSGMIEIGASFSIVLAAVAKVLAQKKCSVVVAIGADNRRFKG